MKAVALVLLLSLAAGAWADDRQEILDRIGDNLLVNPTITRGWAVAAVSTRDYEGNGTLYLRKMDGEWHVIGSAPGGVLTIEDLYDLGFPLSVLHQLYPRMPQVDDELRQRGPVWPETGTRLIWQNDLKRKTAWQRTLMRNEIFARHGYRFQDPYLREYFSGRSWYRPVPNFSESSLSPLELRNARFILRYQ